MNRKPMKKNVLEWIVFALSSLLILAVLGYLTMKAFTYKDSPPDLRIEIKPEQDKLDRNILRIELTNLGEQTAENVTVEVTLVQNGQEVDKAEVLFPLAPKESLQEAWVTFRVPSQPGQQTKIHILGYNKP